MRVPSLHSKTEDESGYPARLHFRSADLVPAPVFELRLMVHKFTKTKTSVRTTLVLDLLNPNGLKGPFFGPSVYLGGSA